MERTLCILKPDAVKKNVIGQILTMTTEAGFKIIGMKMIHLSERISGMFYEVHKERPFYTDLCSFMSSGEVVVVALEKDNAVADWRTLIGATDPIEAAEGTIRKNFASSKGENAVHGSDSVENANNEISFSLQKVNLYK